MSLEIHGENAEKEGKEMEKNRTFDLALIGAVIALIKELLPLLKDIIPWLIELIKGFKNQSEK